jgi:hypothetical protein
VKFDATLTLRCATVVGFMNINAMKVMLYVSAQMQFCHICYIFLRPVCLKFSTEDVQKNVLIVSFVKTGGVNAILFCRAHMNFNPCFPPLLSNLEENQSKRSAYNAVEHYCVS